MKRKIVSDLDKYYTKVVKLEIKASDTLLMDTIREKRNKNRKKPSLLKNEENKCVICSKKIKGRSETVKHYQVHADEKKKKNKIEASNKTIDNGGFLKCSTCLEEFLERDEFQIHEDHYHIQRPFMCAVCNKCFKTPQHYISHMKIHRPVGKAFEEPLKCPDCDFTTTFPLAYSQHINSHPKLDNPFMCRVCGACFIVRKDLYAHRREMHKNKKISFFQCNICQREFTRRARIRDHVRSHTGQAKEKRICDICGKNISVDNMKEHKRIHEGLKPHACTYCEKRFTSRKVLKDHIRVHSGEKPFACEYCGKCFSQRTPLTIHLRLHTGERPYVCPICNKGFVSKGSLGIHLKTGNH